jgi:hypothetical protein
MIPPIYSLPTVCFMIGGIPLSINQPMVKLHVFPDQRNKCKHVGCMIHVNLEKPVSQKPILQCEAPKRDVNVGLDSPQQLVRYKCHKP